MANPDLRRIAQDIRLVQSQFRVRVKIRIANEVGRPVAPRDPFASAAVAPNPDSDQIIWASGVYKESKTTVEGDAAGKVRERRGIVDMNPSYKPFIDKASSIEIQGEGGRFAIVGAPLDAGGLILRVYVKAVQ